MMKFGGDAKYASRITSIITAETGNDMDVGSMSLYPLPTSFLHTFCRVLHPAHGYPH